MRGVCARVRSHARNESNSRRFSPRKLASKSANGNVGPATTGSRIDRNVAEKRAKYARTMLLSPPSFCPFTHRMFSTWWLVVPHVIAPSCSSSRFRRADPMSPTRCHVDECARELSRINTYGNERKRADRSFRGFGPRARGLRVDFQREDWKGFWMVDR